MLKNNLQWSGAFYIGNSFAIYNGTSDSNNIHKHAACQLVYCHSGTAEVIDELGHKTVGEIILIRSMAPHSIRSLSHLTLLYLEPNSALTDNLTEKANSDNISIFDRRNLPIDFNVQPKKLIASLTLLAGKPSNNVDHRILVAMQRLTKKPGETSISEIAKECELSESRLRTIVREQLGVSLASWLVWQKLQSSANKLRDGASLADAAISGGFSDQAHFTRTMRKMFGITPSIAVNALR